MPRRHATVINCLNLPVLGNTPLARGPCVGTGSEGASQPARNACDSGGHGRARGHPGNGRRCQGVQARAPKVLRNKGSPREVVGALEVVEDVTLPSGPVHWLWRASR